MRISFVILIFAWGVYAQKKSWEEFYTGFFSVTPREDTLGHYFDGDFPLDLFQDNYMEGLTLEPMLSGLLSFISLTQDFLTLELPEDWIQVFILKYQEPSLRKKIFKIYEVALQNDFCGIGKVLQEILLSALPFIGSPVVDGYATFLTNPKSKQVLLYRKPLPFYYDPLWKGDHALFGDVETTSKLIWRARVDGGELFLPETIQATILTIVLLVLFWFPQKMGQKGKSHNYTSIEILSDLTLIQNRLINLKFTPNNFGLLHHSI